MKNSTYLVGLIFFFVVSCKKEDHSSEVICTNPVNFNITSPDLIKCKYKPGTYWIVVDSTGMFTDSMRVTEFSQNPLKDECKTHENHAFMVKSNIPGFKRYIVVEGGLYIGFTGVVYSGIRIYDDYDDPIISNATQLDSLFVYDQYYYRVLRVEVAEDWTEGYNRSIYYTNSEYGFLKHEVYDDDNALISNKILMRKNIVR